MRIVFVLLTFFVFAFSFAFADDYIEVTPATSTSSGGHTIEDEGTVLTQRSNMNFTGAGVTASDAGGKTVITISGAGGAGGGGLDENWQWDNANGWIEPVTANTVVDVGRLFATGISASTISGSTIVGTVASFNYVVVGRIAVDRITSNTVYAQSTIGAGGTVSAPTVSGNTINVAGAYTLPTNTAVTGQTVTFQTGGTTLWDSPLAYTTVQDEAIDITKRATINFAGAGVSVADSGNKTVVTIAGGGGGSVSGSVCFVFDGGGSQIMTNSTAWVKIPYTTTLTEWDIIAYTTGSTVIDIRRASYIAMPNNGVFGSIATSDKPTLTSQQRNQDTYLYTTWDNTTTAGDYLQAQVNSSNIVTYLTVTIGFTR